MITRRTTKISASFSVFFPAFLFFFSVTTVLFSGTAALAKASYIKSRPDIAVRTGQGVDYKIIYMAKDGIAVELLEEEDSYARIRLDNGKEGWVLRRFLSEEPPLEGIVDSLRAEKEKLKQRETKIAQELDDVSTRLARSEAELNSVLAERDQLKTDYQTLRQDTADVIKIRNERLAATQENQSLQQELATLTQDKDRLVKDKAFKWFLAGAGVLLVGILLGLMSARSRRRKSSLL